MTKLASGSVFSYLGTLQGVKTLVVSLIGCLFLILLVRLLNVNILAIFKISGNWTLGKIEKLIHKSETRYHRDLEIGKIHEKRRKVKIYRLINDLIIDLGLKQKGATPYEFLFLIALASFIVTLIGCQILFNNTWMIIFMYPIVFAAIMCAIYTKANIAHDARIEAVIESENIICNNIKDGVVVAVRNSIHVIPTQVRQEYKDFLDNVQLKNYHIRTALLELNANLGSVSDDFIKKCIVFELEEEQGIIGMFSDVVEINNIKMEMRIKMKRAFEEEKNKFILGASMIFLFLGGILAIYKDIANFYLRNPVGQIIIALDALIIIGEFVYITYLRAKEL